MARRSVCDDTTLPMVWCAHLPAYGQPIPHTLQRRDERAPLLPTTLQPYQRTKARPSKEERPVKISREWAMPCAWTFSIPPIEQLLRQEGAGIGVWADPFSGQSKIASLRNDLNPERQAENCMDALAWLRSMATESVDGVLYDPPYSLSQASEMYASFGAELLGHHPSNMGYWADIKDEIARVTQPGGKVIGCGWNSNGLGLGRGFAMIRILLVAHGGSKNDTIVTVETKLQGLLITDDVPETLPRLS